MDFFSSLFGNLFGGNAGGATPQPQQPDPAMGQFLSFLPNFGEKAPVNEPSSWQIDHSVPADLSEAVMAPFADQPPRVATTSAPREAPTRQPYSAPQSSAPIEQGGSVWDPVELSPVSPTELAPVAPETISEVDPYGRPAPARAYPAPPSKLGGPLTKDLPDFAKATRIEAAPRLIRSDPTNNPIDVKDVVDTPATQLDQLTRGTIPAEVRNKKIPAAIRTNNPGAMWGGASWQKRYGVLGKQVLNDGLGQGNNIAIFPTMEAGAAAQFDLLNRKYANFSLGAAVKKWSGGNSWQVYAKRLAKAVGVSINTPMSEVLADRAKSMVFASTAAAHEAGVKVFPMTPQQWGAGYDLFVSKNRVAQK